MTKKKRLTIYFPSDATRALNSLAARCNIGDGPDVLRAAIDVYAGLIELGLQGTQIVIRRKGGGQVTYTPFTRIDSGAGHGRTYDVGENDTPRNFVFSGEVEEKIEWILAHSYLPSNAAAVRAALTSFGELIDVDVAGDKIVLVDSEGKEQNFSPFTPQKSQKARAVAPALPA